MPLKTIRIIEEVEQTKIVGASCDRCGKSSENKYFHNYDLHLFKLSGGYGHTYPHDLQTLQFVVCSDCLRKWTSEFLTQPQDTSEYEFKEII